MSSINKLKRLLLTVFVTNSLYLFPPAPSEKGAAGGERACWSNRRALAVAVASRAFGCLFPVSGPEENPGKLPVWPRWRPPADTRSQSK